MYSLFAKLWAVVGRVVGSGHVVLAMALAVAAVWVTPALAAVTWDANASGSVYTLNWGDALNWDTNVAPTASDDVVFPTPIPNPGGYGTPGALNMAFGSVANSLTFNDSYSFNSGELTLSSCPSEKACGGGFSRLDSIWYGGEVPSVDGRTGV